MRSIMGNRVVPCGMLLAALLLRAAIPAGYMPAGPGSGLLFELCPEGMPTRFSAARDRGHHHHIAGSAAKDARTGDDPDRCPIGHMLASAVAIDSAWQTDGHEPPAIGTIPFVSTSHGSRPVAHRSRGPPA